jgi:hypothetical protein
MAIIRFLAIRGLLLRMGTAGAHAVSMLYVVYVCALCGGYKSPSFQVRPPRRYFFSRQGTG